MRRPDGPTVFLGTSVVIAVCLVVYLGVWHGRSHADYGTETAISPSVDASSQQQINFNGAQALKYLRQLCLIGPRPSGSDGMRRQQALLTEHFQRCGGEVSKQEFEIRHPQTGEPVPVVNLRIEWHPERLERILLCAHYDTRPFPDRDRYRPRGTFLGANDGASGVAVLMELGQHLAALPGPIGVDVVLFDAEEFVFDDQRDRDYYFVGSTYFARNYRSNPPKYRYQSGVLLDMVGDARLELYQEKNSVRFARSVVNDIWNTANRLGVREFKRQIRHELRDDHLPLNEIANIPTCDIIDFDYPRPGAQQSYWHTEADSPDKCSADSLGKVGWVVLEWLKALTPSDDSRPPAK